MAWTGQALCLNKHYIYLIKQQLIVSFLVFPLGKGELQILVLSTS